MLHQRSVTIFNLLYVLYILCESAKMEMDKHNGLSESDKGQNVSVLNRQRHHGSSMYTGSKDGPMRSLSVRKNSASQSPGCFYMRKVTSVVCTIHQKD